MLSVALLAAIDLSSIAERLPGVLGAKCDLFTLAERRSGLPVELMSVTRSWTTMSRGRWYVLAAKSADHRQLPRSPE